MSTKFDTTTVKMVCEACATLAEQAAGGLRSELDTAAGREHADSVIGGIAALLSLAKQIRLMPSDLERIAAQTEMPS